MTNITKDERKNWIGGSEIAALFGLSPYMSKFDLWHRKKGTLPEPDLDNERVRAGNHLEPAIADWFKTETGIAVRRVHRYMEHPTVSQFGTSLDYETVTGHLPVEIKNVDGLIFRDKWEADGDIITDAPMHIILQLQAQMACAGKDRGYLVACVGGNKLYYMEVAANPGAIKRFESEVEQFWASIRENRAPEPDFTLDASSIAVLYRDASDAEIDMTGNNLLTSLVHDYKQAADEEKAAKALKAAKKAEILTIIGDAKKVKLDGFTISATTTKEAHVEAHTKKAFRNFRVTAVKNKEAKAA